MPALDQEALTTCLRDRLTQARASTDDSASIACARSLSSTLADVKKGRFTLEPALVATHPARDPSSDFPVRIRSALTAYTIGVSDLRGRVLFETLNELLASFEVVWTVGDRYTLPNGTSGVVVQVSDEGESLYGCDSTDRLVYEYGPDDACCRPLSELRRVETPERSSRPTRESFSHAPNVLSARLQTKTWPPTARR